jgi:hypothetical protein
VNARSTPWYGWVALALASLAAVYGALFIVWAVAAPSYSGGKTFLDLSSSTGAGLLLASQSLLASCVVWALLHRHCSSGDRLSGTAAEWLTVAFLVWAFLGGFSLSFGTFPAAVLLLAAVLMTPSGAHEPA